MRYRRVWLLALSLLLGVQWVPAKSRKPINRPLCPTVSISCTDPSPTSNYLVSKVNIVGIRRSKFATAHTFAKITYMWSISAGKIISGQGTSRIIIDKRGLRGQWVTVTVEVDGLPSECGAITQTCSQFVTR